MSEPTNGPYSAGGPTPEPDYPGVDPARQSDPARQFDPAGQFDPGAAPDAAPLNELGRQHPAPGFNEKGHVSGGRVSGVWVGLIATALFIILLVIFIAQNSRRVSIHFFGWHGQFSLALTVLLSAVVGILLVAIPGSLRILQLRRALRKNVPGGMR